MSVRNKFIQNSIRTALQQTRNRQTQRSSFSDTLKGGLQTSSNVRMSGVAAPHLPGGTVLGAAIGGSTSGGGVSGICQEISDGVGDLQNELRIRIAAAGVDPRVMGDLEVARKKLQEAATRLGVKGL